MKASLIVQPLGSKRVGDWLIDHLTDPAWDRFRAAVAFAKVSGTKHIAKPLTTFCATKAAALSVGIDHRGTSQEALQALLNAMPGQELYVCHHAKSSTFHPKLYLFNNSHAASALIGSNNLTEGGLFTNYEIAGALVLDLAESADKHLYGEICAALAAWSDVKSPIVKALDAALLKTLSQSGLVPTETEIASEKAKTQPSKPFQKLKIATIFGSPAIPAAPPASAPGTGAPASGTPATTTTVPQPTGKGPLRWRKANLQKSDAARPSSGSAPTANLRLSQAKFVGPTGLINWQKYFRNDVFGHLTWTVGQNNNQETMATFNISANGKFLGTFKLRISHNPKREEGQSNVTTVLHWGSAQPSIRQANAVGKTLELYGPDASGAFTIEIN